MAPKKRLTSQASTGLSRLASRSFVSERGLAEILKDIKANPELLEVSSRSSLKRSREQALDVNNLYGSLLRRMTISYEDDASVGLEFSYVDPISMLSHAVLNCKAFGDLFMSCHDSNPSSPDDKWDLILYSDEVTLGDPLSSMTKSRKVQAIYWSIKQLGPEALSCDTSWFFLTCIRSQSIIPIGGLSVLTSRLIDTFFEEGTDVRTGIKLRNSLVFLDLGVIVQDYDAVKHMFKSKGAAGLIVCIKCQNCIDRKRTDLHSDYLVSSAELDITKFHKHDANSIADAIPYYLYIVLVILVCKFVCVLLCKDSHI